MIVDSFYLVPAGEKCRPVAIDTRDKYPEGGWRYVSWAFRDKESWLSYDGLSGREALGKWEVGDNE